MQHSAPYAVSCTRCAKHMCFHEHRLCLGSSRVSRVLRDPAAAKSVLKHTTRGKSGLSGPLESTAPPTEHTDSSQHVPGDQMLFVLTGQNSPYCVATDHLRIDLCRPFHNAQQATAAIEDVDS